MVDALVSNTNAFGRAGSTPALGTKQSEKESESDISSLLFFTLTLNPHSKMFDFEKLTVYQKAKSFNAEIRTFIQKSQLDPTTTDQLRRASFSIVLNLAEGSGRFSKKDRRNFFVISRSSLFELVAILDILKDEEILTGSDYNSFYLHAEELSKILFSMIKNLSE